MRVSGVAFEGAVFGCGDYDVAIGPQVIEERFSFQLEAVVIFLRADASTLPPAV